MKFFNRKWRWKYEIGPMYAECFSQPMTANKQKFKVMSMLEHTEDFFGDRLPEIGEFIRLPGFDTQFRVRDIRAMGPSKNPTSRGKYSWVIVNIDPNDFGDADYWYRTKATKYHAMPQMHTIEGWQWTTDIRPWKYERFGFTPNDWVNPKLKFKERDFVLKWRKAGPDYITSKGERLGGLDPIHSYLFDWFPEVKGHLY